MGALMIVLPAQARNSRGTSEPVRGERCVKKCYSGKNQNVDDWLAGLTYLPETDSFESRLFEMSAAI
jgi:hypothetical protein